ncbi:MAG: cation-translocating P-type ATPase [Chloroflexota bacterium]
MQATSSPKTVNRKWHTLDIDAVFDQLSTGPDGLSASEAQDRLNRFGPNTLPTEDEVRPLDILLAQVRSPLIYVLIAAAVAALIFGELIDVGVILSVVVLNSVVGFFQEFKAEQSLRALAKIVAPRARVIRDGAEREVDASELVPGDVVLLESGVRVPADARLIRHHELQVDESTLTGESLPVLKQSNVVVDPRVTLADQHNMVFLGTLVLRGRGAGVVVATGADTVMGEISAQVKGVGRSATPLQAKLGQLARLIVLAVLALGALVVGLGMAIGETFGQIMLTAVSMAVATVPEGLPVTVTVALAVGVSRMAKRNAIVRKLPAVETLGSTTVIGSDKTGTLTKNEMTTVKVFADGKTYDVTGTGYSREGTVNFGGYPVNLAEHQALEMTLRAGLLANESRLYRVDGNYLPDGDPTEVALIVAAEKAGLLQDRETQAFQKLDEMPFESDRQYMATLHSRGSSRIAFVKGAPERIIAMSTSSFDGEPLDRDEVADAVRQFAAEGLRVLAMGYKQLPEDAQHLDCESLECNLTFLGLQGLLDPPRPEAIEAIARAKEAGIRVVMITGDQKITAQAIAEKMGIDGANGGQPRVLEGSELMDMTDDDLHEAVEDISIYARATPVHKLRIVQQLRRRGEVVAVTGDGVNDAPALKAADIGVAMGKSGTDVAKEAAEMVLTDDNFASIFAAVQEGRVVFDNIRKVILFLIPTGFSIVLVVLASILLGLPLPFLPAQVIWINLVTNGLQDVAMAFEPAEGDVTKRPPRDPREGILTRCMMERTVLVAVVLAIGTLALFATQLNMGMPLDQARTVALTTMVLFQNFHVFNTRSFNRPFFTMNPLSNRFLFASIVGALGLHLLALHYGPLQTALRTQPLSAQTWLLMIAVASSVLLVVEIDKMVRRVVERRRASSSLS